MLIRFLAVFSLFAISWAVGAADPDSVLPTASPGSTIKKTLTIQHNQWRKLGELKLTKPEDDYRYCPGLYRTYMGVIRCRESAGGFLGAMGSMVDATEQTLTDYLQQQESFTVRLTAIREQRKQGFSTLTLDYDVLPEPRKTEPVTKVTDSPVEEVRAVAEPVLSPTLFGRIFMLIAIVFFAYKLVTGFIGSSETQERNIDRELQEVIREASRAVPSGQTSHTPIPSVTEILAAQTNRPPEQQAVPSGQSTSGTTELPLPIEGKRKINLED